MRLASLLTAAAVAGQAAAGATLPAACLDSNAPQQLPGTSGTVTLGTKAGSGGDPLPADTLCWWEIPAPLGAKVQFDFQWVNLGVSDCDPNENDVAVVQVFDSTDPDTALSSTCYLGSSGRRAEALELRRRLAAQRQAAGGSSTSVISPHTAILVMETPPKYTDAYGFEVKYAVLPASGGSSAVPSPVASPSATAAAADSSSAPSAVATASAAAASPTASTSVAASASVPVSSPSAVPATLSASQAASTPSATAPVSMSAPPLPPAGSGTAPPKALSPSASAAPADDDYVDATPTKSAPAAAVPSRSSAPAASASRTPAPPAAASSSPTATASSEPGVVLPSPPPSSSSPLTAVLSIPGINSVWSGRLPSTIISGAHSDLAAATGAEPYRFAGFIYTPAKFTPGGQRTPPTLSFQVLPPAPGRTVNPYRRRTSVAAAAPAEDSTFALVTALYTQLQDPSSALRTGTTTRGLTPDAAAASLGWTSPAALRLTPDGLLPFKVPYSRSRSAPVQRDTLTLTNAGGAPVVVTALSLTVLDSPYPSTITSKLLTLDTSTLPGQLPVSIPAGSSVTVSVVADPSVLPPDASGSVFAMVSIDHNVPDGPHAVGVAVDITGASGGGGGSVQDEVQTPAFRDGALTGLGAAVAAALLIGCCVRRCNKKRGHPSNSISSSTESSKSGSSGGGSGHVAVPRGGRISLWDLLFSRKIPYSRAPGWNNGGAGGESSGVAGEEPSSTAATGAGGVTLEMRSVVPPLPGTSVSANTGTGLPGTPSSTTTLSSGGMTSSAFTSPGAGVGGVGARAFGTPQPTLGGMQQHVTSTGPAASPAATVSAALRTPVGASTVTTAPASLGSPTPSLSGGAGYTLRLRAKPVMKAAEFESRWASLSTVDMWGATMLAPPAPGQLEAALAREAIACMASGVMSGVAKYYFYAQEEAATGRFCMAEVSLTLASLRLSVVLKAPDAALGGAFLEVFKRPVRPLLRPE